VHDVVAIAESRRQMLASQGANSLNIGEWHWPHLVSDARRRLKQQVLRDHAISAILLSLLRWLTAWVSSQSLFTYGSARDKMS
jgi:hypothetical protein